MAKILYALIAGFSLIACSTSTPKDFKAGSFQCDRCKMNIVDMPFKTEAVTVKGKYLHFDSVECLANWMHEHGADIKIAWVTDYFHPTQWIDFTKAFILHSQTLKSPMGAYLSAYATREDLERAKQTFGGEETTLTP
ncbi:MAG: nitrous oxide reductase accessory protein NosL [Deltaproteobacteria bacterium]|nr:nitrous oxide reductase accessory protein NosL [Deltaproteobacteria bacterium]